MGLTPTSPGGTGFVGVADESDGQHTAHNTISDCVLLDPDDRCEFPIRMSTDWTLSLAASEYTRFVQSNTIRNVTVIGGAKSAIELPGPATRNNYVSNSVATGVAGYGGIFEADFGAKDNQFDSCTVYDCEGTDQNTNMVAGFAARGGSGSFPDRTAERNSFVNCHVSGLNQLSVDTESNGFETYRSAKTTWRGCYASDLTVQGSASTAYSKAYNGLNADDLMIEGCQCDNVGIGIHPADATGVTITGGRFSAINDGYRTFASGTSQIVLAGGAIIEDATDGVHTAGDVDQRVAESVRFRNVGTQITGAATRRTVGNVGENAGDPNSTGDWFGNGREGVTIRDTTNGVSYLFLNGSFVAV